jgi:hypothetical protein
MNYLNVRVKHKAGMNYQQNQRADEIKYFKLIVLYLRSQSFKNRKPHYQYYRNKDRSNQRIIGLYAKGVLNPNRKQHQWVMHKNYENEIGKYQ